METRYADTQTQLLYSITTSVEAVLEVEIESLHHILDSIFSNFGVETYNGECRKNINNTIIVIITLIMLQCTYSLGAMTLDQAQEGNGVPE